MGSVPTGGQSLGNLQGVLEVLKNKQAQRQLAIQNQMTALKQQELNDSRQAQIDLHHETIDNNEKQHQLALKAMEATRAANVEKTKQDIADKIMSGGVVPNDTVSAAPDSGQDKFELHTIAGDDNQPFMQVKIPTRETFNRWQTDRKRAELTPEHENKLSESAQGAEQRQSEELLRQTGPGGALTLEQMRRDSAEKIAKNNQAAENWRRQSEDAAALQRTRLTMGLDSDGWDSSPYIERLKNGQASDSDIKKELPKGQAQKVFSDAVAAGVVPMTDKEKQAGASLGSGANTLKLMDQFNTAMQQQGARIPGTQAYTIASNLQNQIKEGLINTQTALGTNSRISDSRVKALATAYTPSMYGFNPSVDNEQKMHTFYDVLDKAIDSTYSNLPSGQRAHIKQTLGLPGQQQPQTQSQPPTPQTVQSQPQPNQPSQPVLSPNVQQLLQKHNLLPPQQGQQPNPAAQQQP